METKNLSVKAWLKGSQLLKKGSLSVLLMFLCLVILPLTSAASPDSLYSKANELYKNSDFEEAISLYRQIDSLGYVSSDLYYNTANAYFRSNKLGKARLYYEKALKLNPSDEDIRNNLNFTETFLADKFEEVPVLFFVRWYQDLVSLLNSNNWAKLSILFFLFSLTGFILYVFIHRNVIRRSGFYLGIITILFAGLSLFFSIQQNRESNAAIIMNPSVNVKSAPRSSGKDLFILHEGAKVWVNSELEEWKEIRISDGRKGWVPAGTIELI